MIPGLNISIKDLTKIGKMVSSFQDNPNQLKEYGSYLVDFFQNLLHSANAKHATPGNDVCIMITNATNGPVLRFVTVNSHGTLGKVNSCYLANFINDMDLKGAIDTAKAMHKYPMSMDEAQHKVFGTTGSPQILQPVKTQPTPDADSDWEEIQPRLAGEYSRSTCDTLLRLLQTEFPTDEATAILNNLKLADGWNAKMHEHIVQGLWYGYPVMVSEIQRQLDSINEADKHLPTRNLDEGQPITATGTNPEVSEGVEPETFPGFLGENYHNHSDPG